MKLCTIGKEEEDLPMHFIINSMSDFLFDDRKGISWSDIMEWSSFSKLKLILFRLEIQWFPFQ